MPNLPNVYKMINIHNMHNMNHMAKVQITKLVNKSYTKIVNILLTRRDGNEKHYLKISSKVFRNLR